MNDDSVYVRIAQKFDQHAAGAPRSGDGFSEAFIEYLKLLYSPEAAELVQHLKPMSEFYGSGFNVDDYVSAGRLAELSGKKVDEVRSLLDPLAHSGALAGGGALPADSTLVTSAFKARAARVLAQNLGAGGMLKVAVDTVKANARDLVKYGPRGAGGVVNMPTYALPVYPSLLNVHQFYPEASEDDLKAGELYQQFFIKDGYAKYYEGSEQGTPTWRTIPVKRSIRSGQKVLDSEEAHAIIDNALELTLVPCPCRTRAEKLGARECQDQNPVANCIMLGLSALMFEAQGLGQPVTGKQAKKYFDEMQEQGLVGTTENFQNPNHAVICLCCECCCSMIRGRTRWGNPDAVLPSNFVPNNNDDCVYCGKCATRCPMEAISVNKETKSFAVEANDCLGCGVCAIACKKEALRLERVERSQPCADARDMHDTIGAENKNVRERQ